MALMLKSGLTVRDALKVSASAFRDKKTGRLISTLSDALNKGISLPDALDSLGSDFSPLYRGMVRIGDQTGSMDSIFVKLSGYLNDEKAMKEKIRGALIYPLMVIIVLLLFMIVIFFFIFPRLKNSFSGQSLDLVFTRFQLMMLAFLIPMTIFMILVISLIAASKTSGPARFMADKIFLRIPIAGNISLLRSCLNLTFSLEVLTSSGFPIESAIRECRAVIANSVLNEALNRIGNNIVKGMKLSDAFSREKVWPERIALWVGVGEASGDVGAVFSQLKTYFQGELDKRTSRIMVLIEPALILLMGGFMILFVILFVVPLFGIFGAGI
nr:type II secretion system F family protein [Spirochaeta isovalerica]